MVALENIAFQGRLTQPKSTATERLIPWSVRRRQWLETAQLLGIVGLEMDEILRIDRLNLMDELRYREDDE